MELQGLATVRDASVMGLQGLARIFGKTVCMALEKHGTQERGSWQAHDAGTRHRH